jgi:uncharacterized damage-inducible protein DinB
MDAISGLDEAGLRARPAAGSWTAAEVLTHLLTTERLFVERARAGLDADGYEIVPSSDAERTAHLDLAKRMAVPQIVHGLLAARRDTERLLAAVTDASLERRLHHPRLGEITVGWLFGHIADHEVEHAGQIRELRQARATEAP